MWVKIPFTQRWQCEFTSRLYAIGKGVWPEAAYQDPTRLIYRWWAMPFFQLRRRQLPEEVKAQAAQATARRPVRYTVPDDAMNLLDRIDDAMVREQQIANQRALTNINQDMQEMLRFPKMKNPPRVEAELAALKHRRAMEKLQEMIHDNLK
jgi:hypothetical protein